MASDVEFRKLYNLRVIDLRTELGKRNLDKTGVKNELIERLQKALISEGHDPEEYLFDVESAEKKTSRSSKRRTLDENDLDKEENGVNDTSSIGEEDSKNMKNQEDSKEEADVFAEENSSEDIKKETVSEEVRITVEQIKEEEDVKIKTESIENVSEVEPSTTENFNAEKVVNKKDELVEEKIIKNDVIPKEQRVNVSKKVVTEESKEKPNDANKEDNEDSINLTIGEDEVKLFGEEEETTHEKDVKEGDKSNNPSTETEKENQSDNSKTDHENKPDQKLISKKISNTKTIGCSRNLWVSGLSSMTRATDLKTLFSKYGKVVAAKIVTNAKTPGSRCYGYVTMLSTEDATVSMQNLHKTELDGRMILVERAKDDGTGPARPKTVKKEPEKKKLVDSKDEKKVSDDKRKVIVLKSNETETKSDDKKDEKKTVSQKDTAEDINGESKTGSVKSEKIAGHHDKMKRSRSKEKVRNKSKEPAKHRSGVLTFAQIKEERERHRLKEKERALRLEERRRQIERERQRDIERRQREEAVRLERERMKLKMEREKMKAELLKLEREAQRLERERLQREKEELRRAQMKLEETRRAVKRPLEEEPRRVTKRPLEITRTFEDDRKRRPPSPDRRHIHVHVSSTSSTRKEISSRSNGTRRPSPTEYVSRRGYESSTVETSRKDQSSHSTRDKSTKESSRYDHHYQSSHSNEEVRSKDLRHRYPDPPAKSSAKESGRYERGGPSENWGRSSSGNTSSSVKAFSGMSSSAMSARDAWGSSSSDRKTEQPPWTRSTVGSSTSERWASSSGSTSGMSMSRSGPVGNSSAMFSGSGSYSDSIPSMGMMGLSSGPSYSDRFDAYKSNLRKY